jgi:hypothetical protein
MIRSLIRPFIAVVVVATLMYLFVSGKLESNQLLTLSGPIIGFYFGERAAKKRETPPEEPPIGLNV